MRNQRQTLLILSFFIGMTMLFVYCRKPDQELANDQQPNPTFTPTPENQLNAIFVSTPPVVDGTIDALWSGAPVMQCNPIVPNPGNGMFAGYIGRMYTAKMRCVVDSIGGNIYFLAEYDDPTNTLAAAPWFFDNVSHTWKKEGSQPTFDANGIMTRQAFQQDKFGVLWNIRNSCEAFKTQSCYGSCHMFTAYRNNKGVMVPNASGNHYTNIVGEKIDMWHFKLGLDLPYGKGSDEYQDFAFGASVWDTVGGNANGRHTDGLVASNSYATVSPNYNPQPGNTQNLKVTITNATVAVPMWFVLDPSSYKGYYNYLDAADTTGSNPNVVFIVAVDSMGVLDYAANRGGSVIGSINPNVGTDYMRGPATSAVPQIQPINGKKCQPASFASAMPPVGRDDIDLKAVHTGSGWILEWKRKLTTPDVLMQDVDFRGNGGTPSSTGVAWDDIPFGIGIFDNANNQHAIKPGLMLHFKR